MKGVIIVNGKGSYTWTSRRWYPVGSIYLSLGSTNPGTLFGGTWEQIKGRFLLGTGSPGANTDSLFGDMINTSYNASLGSLGGQDSHKLLENQIPSHTHSIYPRLIAWDTGNVSLANTDVANGTWGENKRFTVW